MRFNREQADAAAGLRTESDIEALVNDLARRAGMSGSEARRLVGDVVAYFAAETPTQFIVRRHREMQREGGLDNDAIFAVIQRELVERCFAAPRLSRRQIRRVIYG